MVIVRVSDSREIITNYFGNLVSLVCRVKELTQSFQVSSVDYKPTFDELEKAKQELTMLRRASNYNTKMFKII